MRCPHCKNKVLQKSGDSVRLRAHGPVEFHDDGTCKTKCHWCKQPVVIPLALQSADQIPSEKFIIKGERYEV